MTKNKNFFALIYIQYKAWMIGYCFLYNILSKHIYFNQNKYLSDISSKMLGMLWVSDRLPLFSPALPEEHRLGDSLEHTC